MGCLATFAGDFLAAWLAGRGAVGAVEAGLWPMLEALAGWLAVTRIARADPQLPNLAAFLRYLPAACLA
ncbi:MAG: hypothetical protein N2322_04760, partial [Terrimicrobiaceae bacterium]|nr:hypothetical protein [Terrimicrobiaceae bacterium]